MLSRTKFYLAIAVTAIVFALPLFASPPSTSFGFNYISSLTLDAGPAPDLHAIDSHAPAFGVLPAKYEAVDLVMSDPAKPGKRAAKNGNALRMGDVLASGPRHFHLLL